MKAIRLASFGLRGYVGEALTPNTVLDFTSAFATFVEGGRVLLGRDTRYSSPMLHAATLAGLLSAGCEVLDMGICPTPMLQYAVPRRGAAGGISISGGHNAMGWNALTLVGRDGAFLEPVGGEKVLDIFHAADFLKRDWKSMGTHHVVDDYAGEYFDALERQVDCEVIRRAGLTVLIDPVGGAGCPFLAEFARRFGLKLVPVNARPSGYLAREAEPRPRSALQMASIIRYVGGDIGFVLSSDMGRVSIVTEDGEPASEEYTLALVAAHVLKKQVGPVVTNCCTTRTLDEICEERGARLIKTPVGQAYVVSALADEDGLLGGEGSGSVCLPSFSKGFDGFLVMAVVMEAMASKGVRVSELLRALPRYHIEKRNVACGSREGYRVLEMLRERLAQVPGGRMDLTDGLRVDWDDGWVHTRPSRTQQLVRVISEADTSARAAERAEEIVRLIENQVG